MQHFFGESTGHHLHNFSFFHAIHLLSLSYDGDTRAALYCVCVCVVGWVTTRAPNQGAEKAHKVRERSSSVARCDMSVNATELKAALRAELERAGKLEQARAMIRGAVFEALHDRGESSTAKKPLTDRSRT